MSTISPARLAANRANALHSTGPRTQEGKLRSSQNALTHGLTSTHSPLLPNEDPAPFHAFRESMLQDLSPQSPQELELAERIVSLHWRLRRCPAIEAELLSLQTQELHRRHDIDQEDLTPRRRTPFITPAPTTLLALQFNTKDDKSNPLARLQRYESTLDRTLRRCQADYRSLQLSRQPIQPTEEETLQNEPTPSPAPPPPLPPLLVLLVLSEVEGRERDGVRVRRHTPSIPKAFPPPLNCYPQTNPLPRIPPLPFRNPKSPIRNAQTNPLLHSAIRNPKSAMRQTNPLPLPPT